MKVLHLLGNTEDTGGILSVVRSLQEATRGDCEHAVWVNRGFVERRQPALDYRRTPLALDEDESHLKLVLRALMALPGLLGLLRRERFSAIHGHTRGAFPLVLFLAALGYRRCVFTNHTYARRVGMYRRASRWNRIRWVFLTPTMARHYGVTPQIGRVDIISACCADHFFSSPLRRTEKGQVGAPIQVVGLGNIVQWKRWHLALEAMSRLPVEIRARLRFKIYGPVTADGPAQEYASMVRRRIHELGLDGHFELPGPTNRVAEVLAASDWYVVLSENEPCSVSLMEALAGGMPALVSASGGNLDIVVPEVSGVRFRTDDVDDLAERLKQVVFGQAPLGSPEQIRETVRGRSASQVGQQYLRIYKEVAEGR